MAEQTLLQLIASGRIAVGTRLSHPTRRRAEFASEGDIVAVGLKIDGRAYRTPSAAAAAITGFVTNGWLFWPVRPSDILIATLRSTPTSR